MSEAESQSRIQTAKLIRSYFDAFNNNNTEAMIDHVSDDIIHDVNQGERREGKDKFREFNAQMTKNYQETLTDIVVMVSKDGSRAAAEFTVNGTYLNTDHNLPPATGQTYKLPAGTFFEIRGDKISRVTTFYNLTDWTNQVEA